MTTDEMIEKAAAEGRKMYGVLKDGTPVFSKQGPDHLAKHPEVVALVEEALLHIPAMSARDLAFTVDLGRLIGTSDCVPTSDDDQIIYRRRIGQRDGVSRFVLNREPQPCSTVAVRLFRNNEGLVVLMTAYIGRIL